MTYAATRHHHITERHKIIFASVSMNAHGSSFIGGSAKLATVVDPSTYLADAIDMPLHLNVTARARAYANPADISTSPSATDDEYKADQPTDTRPGYSSMDDQPRDMEEDPITTYGANSHPKHPPRSNPMATCALP
jgi:hypothetical protein